MSELLLFLFDTLLFCLHLRASQLLYGSFQAKTNLLNVYTVKC